MTLFERKSVTSPFVTSRRSFLLLATTALAFRNPPAFAQGTPALPQLLHLVLLGQSNAGGGDARPAVTQTDPGYGSLRFARGLRTWRGNDHPADPQNRAAEGFRFVPLTEGTAQVGTETAASGFTSHVKAALSSAAHTDPAKSPPFFLASYPHRGGSFLAELDSRDEQTNPNNPRPGPGGFEATFGDDLKRARQEAQSHGWSYGVFAFYFMQGENEGRGRIGPGGAVLPWMEFRSAYAKALKEAYAGWAKGAMTVSGQNRPPPMLITQVRNDWAGMAQLDAAGQGQGIFVTGPAYYVPSAFNSAGIRRLTVSHLTADGQRWLGEQAGKVMLRIMGGEAWKPLQPIEVRRDSPTQVTLRFHVPRPPLRWETENLPMAEDYGFGVWLGTRDNTGARRDITRVIIMGPDTVRLELSPDTPLEAGKPAIIRYAWSSQVGTTPAPVAAQRKAADGKADLVFQGDIQATFTPLLNEGAFFLRQQAQGSAVMLVKEMRLDGGTTVVSGDAKQMRGNFTLGMPALIQRTNPFGNLTDSDDATALFTFTDRRYGRRQGKPYPLRNYAVIFTEPVTG
ncbi:hypothetical protein IAI18_11690 [Acetobacteraceae bacterium H6797]|nr:hypothetical protein [Acetobacteraceae bacterium H6797]